MPGWSRTPRGRRELLAVGLFVGLSVAVPIFTCELFPFSRAPMFADRPGLYCDYAVFAPDGRALDVLDFGLQRNYWGNPLGAGVGFHPPPSVDTFGRVASREEVVETVAARLAHFPDLPWVEVVQTVVVPVDGRRVGVVREQRWRVANSLQGAGEEP